MSAAIGLGGGVMLIAVIAQFLPAVAVIPVHGVVQLGSNSGRALLMRKFIDVKACVYFILGSTIGAFVGGQIVFGLSADYLKVIIALFILFSVWNPKVSIRLSTLPIVVTGGLISTILTMFVGATGPFVAALLKPHNYSKERQVATMAACMVIQHLLKVLVFISLGFVFADYLILMIAMVAFGFVGTYVGRTILFSVNNQQFKIALNILLVVLSVRLLWISIDNLIM
jgi:uncharacterized membrane protein YfcA